MGLFGGGALRRKLIELSEVLDETRGKLDASQAQVKAMEAKVAAAAKEAKEARDAKRKVDKKLEKITNARHAAEQKATGSASRASSMEEDLAEYRRAMLSAKEEAETARAALLTTEGKLEAVKAASQAPRARAPVAAAPRRSEGDDPRIGRLRDQLNELRETIHTYKDQAAEGERAKRGADRKIASELGKYEAVVRELQHNLRSERNAYRMLQSKYALQVDRVKGLEQVFEARLKEAIADQLAKAPAAEAPAAEPKPVAAVLPDKPAVSGLERLKTKNKLGGSPFGSKGLGGGSPFGSKGLDFGKKSSAPAPEAAPESAEPEAPKAEEPAAEPAVEAAAEEPAAEPALEAAVEEPAAEAAAEEPAEAAAEEPAAAAAAEEPAAEAAAEEPAAEAAAEEPAPEAVEAAPEKPAPAEAD